MSSELALHAYVFLGNALYLLLSRDGHRPAGGTEAPPVSPKELAAVYGKLEPLTPATILTAIAEFPAPERELLARCGRLCLSQPEPDFQTLLGVSPEEAEQVLAWLDSHSG